MRSLLGSAIEQEADVTLVDMEAGLEHLSRSGGTLAHADVLIVVMEPSRKSIITAARTKALADELGIARTVAVGNKAQSEADVALFRDQCAALGVDLVSVIPHAPAIGDADRQGDAVTSSSLPAAVSAEIDRIIDALIA